LKKIFILLLVLVLALSLCGTATASDISVKLNGSQLSFDVPPTLDNGRTLVPLRAIFEAIGADVKWDGDTQTVTATKDGTVVALTIGSKTAYKNNGPVELDVPGKIINQRTLVPLRFVGEAFGSNVVWDGNTRTITITSGSGSGSPPSDPPTKSKMKAHFIDVGQGDAILIQFPNGKSMLVDGGPRTAGEKLVSYLKKAGITSIDIVVATHPHEDHIGGLLNVLNNFPVNKVIDSGYPHTSKTYEDYLSLIDQKDISFEIAHAFNSINIDPGVKITILHPGTTMADSNNNSIVLKLQHNQVGFLLTGDAEAEAEKYLMERTDATTLKSDILKVGHHGSRTSTSDAFLKKVSPSTSIIMLGEDNSYGHPHSETITKLVKIGSEVYQTNVNGHIVVFSDGNKVNVFTVSDKPISSDSVVIEGGEVTLQRYVGSIKSDKYHYPSCRYAQSINPENETWFNSKSDAQTAGYVPCGVCKP